MLTTFFSLCWNCTRVKCSCCFSHLLAVILPISCLLSIYGIGICPNLQTSYQSKLPCKPNSKSESMFRFGFFQVVAQGFQMRYAGKFSKEWWRTALRCYSVDGVKARLVLNLQRIYQTFKFLISL